MVQTPNRGAALTAHTWGGVALLSNPHPFTQKRAPRDPKVGTLVAPTAHPDGAICQKNRNPVGGATLYHEKIRM